MVCESSTHLYIGGDETWTVGKLPVLDPSRNPPRQRQAESVEHGACNIIKASFDCV